MNVLGCLKVLEDLLRYHLHFLLLQLLVTVFLNKRQIKNTIL
jgi:hypothetical protein